MKHRLIEVEDGNGNVYYQAQIKYPWRFWYTTLIALGEGGAWGVREWDTIEEAEKAVGHEKVRYRSEQRRNARYIKQIF